MAAVKPPDVATYRLLVCIVLVPDVLIRCSRVLFMTPLDCVILAAGELGCCTTHGTLLCSAIPPCADILGCCTAAGDAGLLYDSVQSKLFTLPEETLVYPAHDYKVCVVEGHSDVREWQLTALLAHFGSRMQLHYLHGDG
jgi:hypothetical protein